MCEATIKYGDSESDHYPIPFSKIFDAFIFKKPKIELMQLDNNFHWTIKDPQMRQVWQLFHEKHAKYRELCNKCHKSVTKSQNTKKK